MVAAGGKLNNYQSPIDDAAEGISVDRAEELSRDDVGLVPRDLHDARPQRGGLVTPPRGTVRQYRAGARRHILACREHGADSILARYYREALGEYRAAFAAYRRGDVVLGRRLASEVTCFGPVAVCP